MRRRVAAAGAVWCLLILVSALGAGAASGAVTWGLGLSNWNFPHPAGSPLFAPSGYDATAIRIVVPYCASSCAVPEAQIRSSLGEMEPLHLGQGNLYVALSCHDWEPCGQPGQTESSLRATLRALMAAFPNINYWSPQNEPEDAAVPTNSGHGGPALAAQLWLDAEGLIADPRPNGIPGGETIVAGDFGMIAGGASNGGGSGPGWYPYRYAQALKARLGPLSAPAVWATHPYYDVQCATSVVTKDFIAHIDAVMGAATVKHIWLDELGVRLDHSPGCANANAFRVARAGTPAALNATRQAEWAAARSYLTLPEVDPRINAMFYYTPVAANSHCWTGGKWDSALLSAVGDGPRVAYDVLTRQAVPASLPAATLLPPSGWVTACGRTQATLSPIPGAIRTGVISGTVTVARGAYAVSAPMPVPTGQVGFYLDRFAPDRLLGSSAVLAAQGRSGARATYALPTASIPPGQHTIIALYSDAVYQSTSTSRVRVSADAHALLAGEAALSAPVRATAGDAVLAWLRRNVVG